MIALDIPSQNPVSIEYLICDYNGTIAKDGHLLHGVKERFEVLSKSLQIIVITADTFGSVQQALAGLSTEVVILKSTNHTQEKKEFLLELGADQCVAIGNGNNDALMLQEAAISIAILGHEGCANKALNASQIVSSSICEALDLLIYPKRLIATLRM